MTRVVKTTSSARRPLERVVSRGEISPGARDWWLLNGVRDPYRIWTSMELFCLAENSRATLLTYITMITIHTPAWTSFVMGTKRLELRMVSAMRICFTLSMSTIAIILRQYASTIVDNLIRDGFLVAGTVCHRRGIGWWRLKPSG